MDTAVPGGRVDEERIQMACRRGNASGELIRPSIWMQKVLLAQGLSTNEIARSLSITSSTVRNHIRNILQKLHVHNRLEAVVYALKQGLLAKE